MPRKARIDAPGALHHIMVRGIEKRDIFYDDNDRDIFVKKLGDIISDTNTCCLAWALMPNHVHLLVRTGITSISAVMQRLLTGYAVIFNLRHERHGHVFHNRYKSILCEEEEYLLELVRYIHLNPLRAGFVGEYQALKKYPYTGHGSILGEYQRDWQAVENVLGFFGNKTKQARRRYREFVRKGIKLGRQPNLVGGGLIRSLGGWKPIGLLREKGNRIKGDERILGSGEFVEMILKQCQEQKERKIYFRDKGYDYNWLLAKVAAYFNIEKDVLARRGGYRDRVAARSVLCYWASRELGLSTIELSRRLNVSQPTVSQSIKRGEKITIERQLRLLDE